MMAPAKRARPAFSPPRPRKSKSSTTTDDVSAGVDDGGGTKKRKSTAKTVQTASSKTKNVSKSKVVNEPRRSRYTSATESESDSLGDDDTDDNDNHNEDEGGNDDDEDEDDEMQDDGENQGNRGVSSSPEPDYILAEVTHDTHTNTTGTDTNNSGGPTIPLPLIHRILHAHFSDPNKTKISKDAREVVGKYIDIFTREAIMRCAFEKSGQTGDNDKTTDSATVGDGGDMGDGGGWLEVDDLEKVAVQLCLDF